MKLYALLSERDVNLQGKNLIIINSNLFPHQIRKNTLIQDQREKSTRLILSPLTIQSCDHLVSPVIERGEVRFMCCFKKIIGYGFTASTRRSAAAAGLTDSISSVLICFSVCPANLYRKKIQCY